ncbi:MAG: hypothetical protein ABI597_03545 [Gammaproteobacteria bacterium]
MLHTDIEKQKINLIENVNSYFQRHPDVEAKIFSVIQRNNQKASSDQNKKLNNEALINLMEKKSVLVGKVLELNKAKHSLENDIAKNKKLLETQIKKNPKQIAALTQKINSHTQEYVTLSDKISVINKDLSEISIQLDAQADKISGFKNEDQTVLSPLLKYLNIADTSQKDLLEAVLKEMYVERFNQEKTQQRTSDLTEQHSTSSILGHLANHAAKQTVVISVNTANLVHVDSAIDYLSTDQFAEIKIDDLKSHIHVDDFGTLKQEYDFLSEKSLRAQHDFEKIKKLSVEIDQLLELPGGRENTAQKKQLEAKFVLYEQLIEDFKNLPEERNDFVKLYNSSHAKRIADERPMIVERLQQDIAVELPNDSSQLKKSMSVLIAHIIEFNQTHIMPQADDVHQIEKKAWTRLIASLQALSKMNSPHVETLYQRLRECCNNLLTSSDELIYLERINLSRIIPDKVEQVQFEIGEVYKRINKDLEATMDRMTITRVGKDGRASPMVDTSATDQTEQVIPADTNRRRMG